MCTPLRSYSSIIFAHSYTILILFWAYRAQMKKICLGRIPSKMKMETG